MTELKLFKSNKTANIEQGFQKLQITMEDAIVAVNSLEDCFKFTSKHGMKDSWFKQYMDKISKFRTDLSEFEVLKSNELVKIYIAKLDTLIGMCYEFKDKICTNPFIDPAKSAISNLKEILANLATKINDANEDRKLSPESP